MRLAFFCLNRDYWDFGNLWDYGLMELLNPTNPNLINLRKSKKSCSVLNGNSFYCHSERSEESETSECRKVRFFVPLRSTQNDIVQIKTLPIITVQTTFSSYNFSHNSESVSHPSVVSIFSMA